MLVNREEKNGKLESNRQRLQLPRLSFSFASLQCLAHEYPAQRDNLKIQDPQLVIAPSNIPVTTK
jgi:hypothetical protein